METQECIECMDLPIGQICKECEIYELRQKIKTLIVNHSDSHVDVCTGCVKILITDLKGDKLMCYCQECYDGYCDDCYSKFFTKMIEGGKDYEQFCDKCWTW